MKTTLLTFLLSALAALSQSIELRSVTILGGVEIGTVATNAAPPAEGFSPADITGLYAWYYADGLTNIDTGDPYLNAGAVTDWADKSGNALHLGSMTFDPVFKADVSGTGGSGLNGKDAVSFKNVDMLVNPSITFAQPFTVFIVMRAIETNAVGFYFISTNPVAGSDTYFGTVSAGSQRLNAGSTITDSAQVLTNSFVAYSLIFNTTSSSIRTNGTQAVAGDAGTDEIDGFILGSNLSRVNETSADIAEVIIFTNVVSGDNLTSMENYMRTNYSIW